MGKIKEEIQELLEICQRKYEEGGSAAVIDYINEATAQGQDMIILEVRYKYCKACEAEMPCIGEICLVCGQSVPDYFQVLNAGYNKDTHREEVEINCGDNGKLLLIKTDEGFVVDVYGQNDHVDTMAVWEEDLNPSEDELLEESNDPRNFSDGEILDFKSNWGQSHSEITANLGYPRSHAKSDELLMDDYFWVEKDKRWYNRCASGFTPREQAIADYLYALSTYQYLNE